MSIVRVGLAETKKFADGYDAIFGRKSPAKPAKRKAKPTAAKKASGRKKARKK